MPNLTNLGPRGVRRRALQGALALLAATPLAALLVTGDARLPWAVPYGVLLWGGVLGVLQARTRT